jgi:hypothetical protein
MLNKPVSHFARQKYTLALPDIFGALLAVSCIKSEEPSTAPTTQKQSAQQPPVQTQPSAEQQPQAQQASSAPARTPLPEAVKEALATSKLPSPKKSNTLGGLNLLVALKNLAGTKAGPNMALAMDVLQRKSRETGQPIVVDPADFKRKLGIDAPPELVDAANAAIVDWKNGLYRSPVRIITQSTEGTLLPDRRGEVEEPGEINFVKQTYDPQRIITANGIERVGEIR